MNNESVNSIACRSKSLSKIRHIANKRYISQPNPSDWMKYNTVRKPPRNVILTKLKHISTKVNKKGNSQGSLRVPIQINKAIHFGNQQVIFNH